MLKTQAFSSPAGSPGRPARVRGGPPPLHELRPMLLTEWRKAVEAPDWIAELKFAG